MLAIFYNKDEIAMGQAFEENSIVPSHLRKVITEKLKNDKQLKLVMRFDCPRKYMLLR